MALLYIIKELIKHIVVVGVQQIEYYWDSNHFKSPFLHLWLIFPNQPAQLSFNITVDTEIVYFSMIMYEFKA